MRLVFLSIGLFIYGYFCDICVNICTQLCDACLKARIPLNKKLLIVLSNFSDKSLITWQSYEKKYIKLCISQGFYG